MFSNSQPGAFNMLILLLLAVPISHGRHYDELGTNKEKQERAADEDFLSRLIDEQPQNSDTTKDNSASTDRNKQSCRTYASFTVRSLHEDACERNLTQALECVTSPEEKLATCRKIPKCDCGPRCRKCRYQQN